MVAVPECLAQDQGHQRTVPGVRRAAPEVAGCVVLADRREVVEQILAQYDDC